MKNFLIAAGTVLLFSACQNKTNTMKEETITILQTADIHAYLNVHEELFVENGSIVFRKAGGLAQIKTLTDSIRNENPYGTLFIDGGDLIQGSGASVRSQ